MGQWPPAFDRLIGVMHNRVCNHDSDSAAVMRFAKWFLFQNDAVVFLPQCLVTQDIPETKSPFSLWDL